MDISEKVNQIYKNYEDRNLEAVMAALPDNFCFEWPFESSTARYCGICRGKTELRTQLESLAENFVFNSYRATNIIVEGNKAAAQVELNLTSNKTGDTFGATIAHFWEFKDGEPAHLIEYMDTALMAHQSA